MLKVFGSLQTSPFFALNEARALAEQGLVARKKQEILLLLYLIGGQFKGRKYDINLCFKNEWDIYCNSFPCISREKVKRVILKQFPDQGSKTLHITVTSGLYVGLGYMNIGNPLLLSSVSLLALHSLSLTLTSMCNLCDSNLLEKSY